MSGVVSESEPAIETVRPKPSVIGVEFDTGRMVDFVLEDEIIPFSLYFY